MAEKTPSTTANSTRVPVLKPEAEEPLPYWLINVPNDQQPAECPEYLLDISDRNKAMINLPQADFHVLTWPEVQVLISKWAASSLSSLIPSLTKCKSSQRSNIDCD